MQTGTFFNQPLHWAICQLHLNELPLRRLFVKLGGATSGSIGKRLTECHLHSVKDFEPIPQSTVLPEIDLNNFSNDQSYLYQIVPSIHNGSVTSYLAAKKPGELNHARWITLASRCCRFYVAVEKGLMILSYQLL